MSARHQTDGRTLTRVENVFDFFSDFIEDIAFKTLQESGRCSFHSPRSHRRPSLAQHQHSSRRLLNQSPSAHFLKIFELQTKP